MDKRLITPERSPLRLAPKDRLAARIIAEDYIDLKRTLVGGDEILLVMKALRDAEVQLAALSERAEWTPVSNGCPPYNPQAEEVLAATITGHVVATHPSRIDMLYQDARRTGEDCFYTHWQPMPKGPK